MAKQAPGTMTIGELAERADVHPETVRYYQRLRLVPTPARPAGSIRRYGADAVRRLRFIKCAQELGFSLDEVKLLFALSIGEHCADTRAVAERKRRLVARKLADLHAIQTALDALIRACGTGKTGRGCPIIEALSRDPGSKPRAGGAGPLTSISDT